MFAELVGYYDAAGAESDPGGVVVTIGLLSTEKKWLRFETQWRDALRIINSPRLHMTHFVANGEIYKHLRDQEAKKAEFLAAAIRAIKTNINKVAVAIVRLSAFRQANAVYRLDDALAGPLERLGERPMGAPRQSFLAILRQLRDDAYVYDTQGLRDMCEQNPGRYPKRISL